MRRWALTLLLSASLPLPLALSTTLQNNYLSLVRQGKGVKLNSHWLLLIAFLDLSDYKLNWRTWRVVLEVRRVSTWESVWEEKRVYVRLHLFCISYYMYKHIYLHMYIKRWATLGLFLIQLSQTDRFLSYLIRVCLFLRKATLCNKCMSNWGQKLCPQLG